MVSLKTFSKNRNSKLINFDIGPNWINMDFSTKNGNRPKPYRQIGLIWILVPKMGTDPNLIWPLVNKKNIKRAQKQILSKWKFGIISYCETIRIVKIFHIALNSPMRETALRNINAALWVCLKK